MISELFVRLARTTLETRLARRLVEGLDLHSDNRLRERGMLAQAFEYTKLNGVRGDYFEFGVYQGRSFLHAHELKRRYQRDDMVLWAFDSFAGLPDIDDHKDNVWFRGQFACSETEFRDILRRAGVSERDYELVPGYYENSLNSRTRDRLAGRCAAIVYIDCDLYSSTKQVLDFVKPFLVNGSVVCFDDYYNYKASPEQGEQRALAEFLDEQNDLKFISWFDYSPLGKSFIARLNEPRNGS